MFVGFIAVIVILLVIVGLMSTGATNGSGGVDQTKATKALSEVSALAQSIGFYKTTTANSDYAGLTVGTLVDSGIVATADTAVADLSAATAAYTNLTSSVSTTETLIASKAVPGMFYYVVENPTSAKNFNVVTVPRIADIPADSTLAAAIEKTMDKLSTSASVLKDTAVDGTTPVGTVSDGAVNITF